MKLKLSDWASIAEIVSGAAVIVTLIILIIGVRDNTQTVRASAYSENRNAMNSFQTEILTDQDALRVWDAYVTQETAELDQLDRQRLTLIVLSFFRIYEDAYNLDQYGYLGDQEWQRFDRNICFWFERARSANISDVLQDTMTRGFFEYVSEACRN